VKHRHIRKRFRHARSRAIYRVALVPAAFLSVAVPSGILLNQAQLGVALNHSGTVATADLAALLGGQASSNSSAAVAVPAPQTTASAAPTAAATPTQAASSTPTKAVPPPPPPPPASKVLSYQFQLQPNDYYCGPAATRIALTARGHSLTQDQIAADLGTTTSGTNSAEDTTRVLNSVNGTNFYHTTSIPGSSAIPAEMDRLQADVVHAISNGYPIVANIMGYALDTTGTSRGYGGGHYVAVVGYSDNGRTVKIADPANVNGDGTYWMSTINMANWMATRGYSS
jgi:hypothetical protein